MAAADAPHSEPTPVKGAEALDAGRRVTGARRVETADVSDQRRQRPPVDANQEEQEAAEHRRSLPYRAHPSSSTGAMTGGGATFRPTRGSGKSTRCLGQLGLGLVITETGGARFPDHHEVAALRKEMTIPPKHLADHPLDAVATHGAGHFLRDGDPQPLPSVALRPAQDHDDVVWRVDPISLALDLQKLLTALEASGPRKTLARRSRATARVRRGSLPGEVHSPRRYFL